MNRYQMLKMSDEKRKEIDNIQTAAKAKVDEFQGKLCKTYHPQIDNKTGKIYAAPVNMERWKREHPGLAESITASSVAFAQQLDEAVYSIFTQQQSTEGHSTESAQTPQLPVEDSIVVQNTKMNRSIHQNPSR